LSAASSEYDARVLRFVLIALLVGCSGPSKPTPTPPKKINDTAVRLRVAHAEAKRGGGIAELVELSKHGAKHERVLALRGLGRIGGSTAIETLRAALSDPDIDVIAAAAAGIGLAASLDEEDFKITEALLAALPRSKDHVAVIEAIGRAGDASAQATLIEKLGQGIADGAIALGRHGRRKITISDDARAALATATKSSDRAVRYAATWALAREHTAELDETRVASVTGALSDRVVDGDPEVRAQAIAALARRKQVKAAAPTITQALIDPDWRVQVEAVRALSADEYREVVATAAVRSASDQVVLEALKSAIGKKHDAAAEKALVELALKPGALGRRVWEWLLGINVAERKPDIIRTLDRHPQRHVVLAYFADWLKTKAGTMAERRLVLRALLDDSDVRVRAAAMGTFGALWNDGDARDHEHAVKTVTAAIASKDPILAGSAIEAADELLEEAKTERAQLASAIVTRAHGEKDVELAASLFGIIGKRGLADGAPACKAGLDGHLVLMRAAIDCLKKLGEPATAPVNPPLAKAPDGIDVASVVGKNVAWRVQTTKGEVVITLLPDVAPWAVATVVSLTKRGFYDGLEFHRVVSNFVVQGGDPTESGWGGPGFMIPAEPGSVLDGLGFVAGGVGIADAGRDSGGSQWFVMHARATHLDGRYTWIGSVSSGLKSADALLIGDEIQKATVEITAR
jgi:cyclophilin family peptidyl-prolyl cis-trans isomerase/HEAT repeat protein